MDPVLIAPVGTGLTSLATNYGIAGILLMVILVSGGFIVKWLMDQFKACHDNSITQFQAQAELNRGVVEKNTDAFTGVQLALAKIEGAMKQ